MKRDPLYQSLTFLNLLFILIAGAVAYFLLPPQIPLFYGNVQITSQLVNRFLFPLPPTIAFLFSILNSFLGKGNDLFLTSIFKMIAVIITIFSALALIKIYWLVGYRHW
jgi:hypothetical protein